MERKMKRLGIYLTYDKQNKIDRYIGYFLKELKTCVSSLVVVCNMEGIEQGEENIRQFADQVFFRKNVGFDAGGFKDALCNLIGWETVLKYDELVLANDSMFGPFYPMVDIFAQMEKKSVDFWGLTKNGPYQKIGIDSFQEHIQTFFLVIRSKMLYSNYFKNYWEEMPYYNSFNQTIRKYELQFTPHFSSLGYTYDVLSNIDINNSENFENNYCQYAEISYELLKKRNFPFFKKKPLTDEFELLEENTQENMRQSIDYIDHETDYNVDLIWDNVLRTLNVADLYRTLHFQYIISPLQTKTANQVSIIIFIAYPSSYEYIAEYLQKIPSECKIEIVSHDNSLLIPYQQCGYHCNIIPQERVGVFLSQFCSCDYVCVLHDTDLTSQSRKSCTGKSFFYNIWNNLVKNKEHIYGIEACFEKEYRLGFLTSPQPNFAEFFADVGSGWNGYYKVVHRIVTELGINCQISENKAPYRVTNEFWIRGCILKRLKDIAAADLPYLPYLWSYLAQDAGYYSGIVESPEYAAIHEVNLQYYLDRITDQVRQTYGEFGNFLELQKRISESALEKFCTRFAHIYVYGTGLTARRYQDILSDIEAYVVSDGQVKLESLNGKPVKYLSEIDLMEDCGIVLCLYKANQAQVISLLKERGFTNYFCTQYGNK